VTIEAIIFFVAAALALLGAAGVVLARNPVHCALLLVVTLVAVAIFFLLQEAQLVAAVQVIVYAGAIVVLFLFVIILLGVDKQESLEDPVPFQRPAALALGAILLAEIFLLAGRDWVTGAKAVRGSATRPVDGADLGNVERVARTLFTDFLWAFELTAALLVIAVVGAVVLARRSGQRAQLDEREQAIERQITEDELAESDAYLNSPTDAVASSGSAAEVGRAAAAAAERGSDTHQVPT
jgi:NADH-quinone oxidoreductase subunit J